jgi:preprotein translocase subunit SecG
MTRVYQMVMLVSGVVLILFILVQARGASLGAGFGGTGELHTERRGVDKTLHQLTILLAVVFIMSILLLTVTG